MPIEENMIFIFLFSMDDAFFLRDSLLFHNEYHIVDKEK